jgi:hypothetical protein
MNKVFKNLALIALFIGNLFAIEPIFNVDVDKNKIYSQESVEITLSVLANKDAKIAFSHLTDIAGEKIIKRKAKSSFDTVDNGGKTEDTIEKLIIYTIKPKKNLTIPAMRVKVDGKVYKSEPIKITIIKDIAKDTKEEPISKKVATKRRDFSFKMIANKTKVVANEPFIVTVKLKEPIELAAQKVRYRAPKFKDCKVVRVGSVQKGRDTNYIYLIERYIVTPKKSGVVKIKPAVAEIDLQIAPAATSMFALVGNDQQTKTLKTNLLNIKVLEKPKNTLIVGEYKIKGFANKTQTGANKQINYTLIISGKGDLTTLDELDLKIDGVTIYPKDAKVTQAIKNNEVYSSYKKEYVLISDSSYTIPSFSINAYSPSKKRAYKLQTKPLHISIKSKESISEILKKENSAKKTQTNISATKSNTIKQEQKVRVAKSAETILDAKYYEQKINKLSNPLTKILYLFAGIAIGILLTIFTPKLIYLIRTKDEKSQLYGSYHEALNILYPHTTKSSDIEEMVKQLYEVTNGNNEITIDNNKLDKMVAKILKKQKRYNLSR